MLILHISDIHFRKDEAGSAMDPNHHLRANLVQDAKQQCEKLDAAPDAVLVSGDIAFSGHGSGKNLGVMLRIFGCEMVRRPSSTADLAIATR